MAIPTIPLDPVEQPYPGILIPHDDLGWSAKSMLNETLLWMVVECLTTLRHKGDPHWAKNEFFLASYAVILIAEVEACPYLNYRFDVDPYEMVDMKNPDDKGDAPHWFGQGHIHYAHRVHLCRLSPQYLNIYPDVIEHDVYVDRLPVHRTRAGDGIVGVDVVVTDPASPKDFRGDSIGAGINKALADWRKRSGRR